MSIGFNLFGKTHKPQLEPERFLSDIEGWINGECSDLEPVCRRGFVQEKPTLFCKFHPAGDEVEFCLADPDHMTVSANTSTVGPGYHIYLCEQLHRLSSRLEISWQDFSREDDTIFSDEANFFFTGRQENVFEAMSRWLRGLCGSFFDGTLDPAAKDIALCMPTNERFRADYLAITQLGPRDKRWLYEMSRGDLPENEFFPWFKSGLNAEYFLGRALVHLWSEVRWRKPVDEIERTLIRSVCAHLRRAYELDSSLQFPWSEWQELIEFLGEPEHDMELVRARASRVGTIGYRRSPVKVQLPGNWWIETDGSFSQFRSDEDGALSSFDPPREIWFTAYSFAAENPRQTFDKMRQNLLAEGRGLTHEDRNYVAAASVTQRKRGGCAYYLLQSSNITLLNRSVCTIVFDDITDREWAIRTWRSLQPPLVKD